MKYRVIDTNVAVVANGRSNQASPHCVYRCIETLDSIVNEGGFVIDDKSYILKEYLNHLCPSGQPSAGDAFMKWIWSNQANPDRCECVTITPSKNREFLEFPDDPQLANFDRKDRKFVAVAISSKHHPNILNAVDSDWWIHRTALAANGIEVEFLCPDQYIDSKK